MRNFSPHVRRIIIALFAVAVLVGVSTTAQAGLIHNLEITDRFGNRGGLSGSGQIAFMSLIGTDPSGVSAFSFTGTADASNNGGDVHRFSLGLNDLNRIAWSIDDNWNLSIGFTTNRITLPTTSDLCLLFAINNPNSVTCQVSGSPLAVFRPGATVTFALFEVNTTGSSSAGTPTSSPVHSPVPAPSTTLLFASGLAGFIAWRGKKSQQV